VKRSGFGGIAWYVNHGTDRVVAVDCSVSGAELAEVKLVAANVLGKAGMARLVRPGCYVQPRWSLAMEDVWL
jgi:hypothetical protein